LKETGYIEGQNLVIERYSAEGHYDRLPALAADLVRRQVAVIVSTALAAALAAGDPAATSFTVLSALELLSGLTTTAMRLAAGTSSRKSPSCLPSIAR
jgi:ABC-type uncharacterized transport system substrate-binding protein